MEKQEKRKQQKTRQFRTLGALLLTACVVTAAVYVSGLMGDNTPSPRDRMERLVKRVVDSDRHVRQMKETVVAAGKFMEVDPRALAATTELQIRTQELLRERYGASEPYRVSVDVTFLPSNPTYVAGSNNEHASFTIELAPAALVPHSVYSFLEIARHWHIRRGSFHRRADHVLQVQTLGRAVEHLAFQEYSPDFPHVKGTVGYAGRPSGPHWYISIQDNRRNHGPGTQQKANPHEADSCFGKVVEGFDLVILDRVTKMPGSGFLKPDKHVLIDKMTIQVPDPAHPGEYMEWKDLSPPIA
jgi:hypothetical protein